MRVKGMTIQHPSGRISGFVLIALFGGLLAACTAAPGGPRGSPAAAASAEAAECHAINESVDTPPYSVQFLMDFATIVFVAEVRSIEAGVWNTQDGKKPPKGAKNGPKFNPAVVTPINLQIDATFFGDAGPGAIRVVNPGGTADCVEHHVSNAPVLQKGKTYVFFVQPSPDADGVRKPELPQVLAAWPVLADGSVKTSVEGTLPLNEVEELVRNPVPPPVEPEPTAAGTGNPG